ncbi:PepSY domain-containing protein [Pseudorhodoferax sp.]|uniref:PepSY domain-containing protein n=1 Tax=Pseudorhodoferax sp. TaxID=1993553 RepID=UPI0039E5B5D2
MRTISAVLLLAALWPAPAVQADPAGRPLQGTDPQAVRRAVEAGRLQPLATILAAAQKRYPGRVVDVEIERDAGGGPLYRFRVLGADGYSREVYFDAVSGKDVTLAIAGSQRVKPLAEVLRQLQAAGLAGPVVEIELERWADRRQVYEIRVPMDDGRLREMVVDAQTGKVLHLDSVRFAGAQKLRPVAEVLDTVLARYPGQVTEVEIEIDAQGRRYYEVEVRTEDGRLLELHVDAATGALQRAAELD